MSEVDMDLDERNQQEMMELWMAQPFYVIEEAAYERIRSELEGGIERVPSFILHNCTHARGKCNCAKMWNTLNEKGRVVRLVGGIEKPVYSSLEVKNWGK